MFLNPGQGSSSVQTRKNPSLKVEASSDLCNGKNYPFTNEKLPDHHPSSSSMLPFSGPDSFYDQQACNEPHAPCALLSTSYPSCIPSTASYDHEKSQVGAGANYHFSRDMQSSQENLPSRDTHYEQLPDVHHGQAWPSGSLHSDLIPSTTGSAAIARLEPSVLHNASSAAPSKRKSRREKPRIELAPDQPPTTQGKPRARVYVACVQCRARKIRCDGAKPVCYNCSKRVNGGSECNYDAIPKRRGPDKTPGARQRAAKDAKDIYSISEVGPARRGRRPDTASRSTTSPESQPSPDPLPLNKSLPDPHSTHNPLPLSSPGSDILPTPVDAVSIYTPETEFSRNNHSAFFDDLATIDVYVKGPPYDNQYNLSTVTSFNQIPRSGEASHAYITSQDDNTSEEDDYPGVSHSPSSNFTRKVWWESLLYLYLSPHSRRRHILTATERASAAQGITSDIRFLFNTSNYWFSFFHLPTFNSNYFDPARRERMQPSLILALLAMATFWQSSEAGYGQAGRERALCFRDEAQSALDASFNSGWIDETLAQAAWLLALFEVCAHPLHSSERSSSSLIMLDSIIRSLSLTFVDADNPKATKFSPGAVPTVLESSRNDWLFSQDDFNPYLPSSNNSTNRQSPSEDPRELGCSCSSMTLISHWQESSELTPLWTLTPAWNNSWNEAEVRKESCRRLCWSSAILAAGHTSYTTAHKTGILKLFISDPANYALLFDGESIAHSPACSSRHSSKDTVWALHDRSFLLWHSCTRMRNDLRASEDMKAHFAIKAWLEADTLEAALNKHTCRIERQFIFQAREYIFNTRMCISYEFQRYIPLVSANVNGLFHRRKAEEWRKELLSSEIYGSFENVALSLWIVTHQATVAERFMSGLHTITGNSKNILARRPFYVFWFMGQISRALGLWECDHTLTVAMDVCKAFLPALDYLSALWPCPEQRYRYEKLRERLANACYLAGVNPPPPPNLTIPSSSPSFAM